MIWPRGHMGPEALISLPPRRLWRVDFRHLELHTFEFDACHVPPKTLFGSPACCTSAPALGHIDTQTHRPRYICSSHGSNRMGVLSQITISLFMLWYYSHTCAGKYNAHLLSLISSRPRLTFDPLAGPETGKYVYDCLLFGIGSRLY